MIRCAKQMSDIDIVALMQNFVHGNHEGLRPEIMTFMNTSISGKLCWIPVYIGHLMTAIAQRRDRSDWIGYILCNIRELFDLYNFRSEHAWQHLFVITFIVRLLGCLDHKLMPFAKIFENEFEISFNAWKICDDNCTCYDFDEIMVRLVPPQMSTTSKCAHIAIIVPISPLFQTYDMIIVIFKSDNATPEIYAYDMKIGMNYVPSDEVDQRISRAFGIVSKPPTRSKVVEGFYVPNASELESFFGVSGNFLNPVTWKESKI